MTEQVVTSGASSLWRDVLIGIVSGLVSGVVASLIAAGIWSWWQRRQNERFLETLDRVRGSIAPHRRVMQLGPIELDIVPWRGLAIDDDGDAGWTVRDVDVRWQAEPKSVRPDVQAFVEAEWDRQRREHSDSRIERGPRCGVRGFESVSIAGRTMPRLTLYPTDYARFLALNKGWVRFRDAGFPVDPRVFLPDGYRFLAESVLSNDLGTGTTVVTADGFVVLAVRRSTHAVLPACYHTSIAEGMLPTDLVGKSPSPFATIVRGAKEELNLAVGLEDVRILAFCMYRPFAQPYVVAEVQTPLTGKQVLEQAAALKQPEGKLRLVEFTVAGLAPYLFEDGDHQMTADSARSCLLFALIHRYGRRQVEHDLNREWLLRSGVR